MPDERVENVETNEPVTTSEPASTSADTTSEPFVSKAQELGDELAEADSAEAAPSETETSDSEDLSDEELDTIIDKELSDAESEESTQTETQTDNTQKRIDELTWRAKQAEEKLAALEKTPEPQEKQPEKSISDGELTKALKDYIDEGDAQGVMDVLNYKLKTGADNLREEYRSERTKELEANSKRTREWQTIVKEYSPDTYDNDIIATNPAFDIRDSKSKLYQLAEKLYTEGSRDKYAIDGGMQLAVKDAFLKLVQDLLLNKKVPRKDSNETEGLKNRLEKEKRKKSLGGGASSTDDGGKAKPQTPKDTLDEVLSERRSYKAKRGAGV